MSPAPVAGAARTGHPVRRPVGPRRVSGPARRPVGVTTPAPRGVTPPLHRVVDHPVLDRLIRGRTWIGIVGFALIGIVAMQVTLLKLNAGIGRSVERATQLTRENSLLTMQVSTLRAADLRQAGTTREGMVYPPPGDVRYLRAGRADPGRTAASIRPPRTTGAGAAAGGSTSQSSTASGYASQASVGGGAAGGAGAPVGGAATASAGG
ncbi:MAG: hypothetical protein QOE27_1459 [Solirubrobacteraceae bacterium]|nr:hypothetical protein [Solirubrobacteraceae bacterium]